MSDETIRPADVRRANRAYAAELRRIEAGGELDLAALLGEQAEQPEG